MAIRSLASRSRHRMMSEMNVVPYIDVMLVLVIILMVAAPFVNPSVVNLPSVQKAAMSPVDVIEVIVEANGKLSIKTKNDRHPVDLPRLVANVQAAQQGLKTPVVIAADKDVRYEEVINVMKSLQQANVERVGLLLQVEHAKR